ncbi:MAG: hypothetical protein GC134_00800 [Proteobacteria bacterium]|nr:hypothetical protein [Pseudomonadota bacterium]
MPYFVWLIGLMSCFALVAPQVQADEMERAGRVIGGNTGDLSDTALSSQLIGGVETEKTQEDITRVNDTVKDVVDYEISRLEDYISTYQPKEETITVYTYANNSLGGDGGGSDDGGSGAGSGGSGGSGDGSGGSGGGGGGGC